ncbi:hypothetical protein P154DRAFT_438712 [Amniculicola lignicola CBS 123094]|uniref:Uncharacterized protein n=1 Tax=Amniculicola lignicola CBS 123094 TaxID=1392246 RepID=A0A6A5WAD4_9PLEO|nr:hypothetical protein P154DRAFT_438712 [Amniculicola lignicola CBS 123094]
MIHTSATVRAFGQKCCQAYITAIEALRKFDLKAFAVTIVQWVKQNPRQATFIMVCFVVSMLLVATMPLILGVVGFTPVGIAAGTIAAGIQASIGNVAAGSLFAFLTSAGMGGAAAPILGVFAPAASAGVMCLGKWLYDLVKNKIDEHKKRQEEMALMKRG